MRKRFRVKNLDCRGCAARIDEVLNDLPEVRSAYLDFDQALLVVDSGTITVDKVNSLLNSIEPGALVEAIKDDGKGKSSGILIPTLWRVEHLPDLMRILVSALIFTTGIIFREPLSRTPFSWAEYAVFLSAYFICGSRVLLTALKNIMNGRVFDEFFLMSLATLTAILIGQLPEAVGVMLFYRTGEFFQDIAASRSRRSVKSLLADRPSEAFRIEGESIEKVSPEEVRPGEKILVRPGEKIPLDGVIRRGSTQVDQSALTGESVPVLKDEGNEVFGGTVNMEGTITVEVTAPFEETAVARIMELVEFAASRKSPTERFITRFARYYTPAVVFLAATVALVPPMAGFGSYPDWIYRALVLLVISCPCALMVSVPLGYFGGIGAASRSGILVKGGNILDALTSVSTVILDKTGTITKGVFEVVSVEPVDGISREHLLRAARLAEGFSNHPVARSIATAAPGIVVPGTALTTDKPGRGVVTVIDGDKYAAGNDKLMAELGIETQATEQTAGTLLNVALNGSYLGRITVSDVIKEEARPLAGRLKNLGVSSVFMLTGDRENVAQSVASEIGLDGYRAGLFPHEKVAQLEKWKGEHQGKVIFAGDGINDAPSIASADIGIAMGGLGSEAAIEIADVVILDDSPSKIGDIISIAKKTRSLVWQNIFLALSVKLLILTLGIAGISSLWEAVFADVGVTLLAVLNSARAIRFTGGRI